MKLKPSSLIPQFFRRKSVTKTAVTEQDVLHNPFVDKRNHLPEVYVEKAKPEPLKEFVVGKWYSDRVGDCGTFKYHGGIIEHGRSFDQHCYGLLMGTYMSHCIMETLSQWRPATPSEIQYVLDCCTPEQRAILDSIKPVSKESLHAETQSHVKMSAEELKFRQGAMWKPENSVSKENLHTETTGGFSSNNGPVPFEPFNDGGTKYPWRLVKSTKHKVMYFLKANYPNSYTGREIARATGLNTSQVGGALKHCGDHVTKVGTHVGSKGCVGFKWQGVLKERV